MRMGKEKYLVMTWWSCCDTCWWRFDSGGRYHRVFMRCTDHFSHKNVFLRVRPSHPGEWCHSTLFPKYAFHTNGFHEISWKKPCTPENAGSTETQLIGHPLIHMFWREYTRSAKMCVFRCKWHSITWVLYIRLSLKSVLNCLKHFNSFSQWLKPLFHS